MDGESGESDGGDGSLVWGGGELRFASRMVSVPSLIGITRRRRHHSSQLLLICIIALTCLNTWQLQST